MVCLTCFYIFVNLFQIPMFLNTEQIQFLLVAFLLHLRWWEMRVEWNRLSIVYHVQDHHHGHEEQSYQSEKGYR